MNGKERCTMCDNNKAVWPDAAERQALFCRYGTPREVVAHGVMVARCATELAQQVNGTVEKELLQAACELHDLVRGMPDHARAGADILIREGYPAVGELIALHHDLPETAGTEACLLYLADKLIRGEQRVSLEQRFRNSREKCRTPEALEAWQRRYDRACRIVRQFQLKLSE